MAQDNKIDYEQTIDGDFTVVSFSASFKGEGKVYKGVFTSNFRQYAKLLNASKREEDVFFFAKAVEPEDFKTKAFVVPHHTISEVFCAVANKWATEAGYPLSFTYRPKGIGILEVTFPSSMIKDSTSEPYGVYTEAKLANEIEQAFSSIVVEPLEEVDAEAVLDDLDLDRLEQYVIVEEEDDKKGDEFVSSLNDENQIEKGADEHE